MSAFGWGPTYQASRRLTKLITFGPATERGTSSATGATTLTDAAASWVTNAYAGLTCYSDGKTGVIVSNTATVLTVASWTGGTPTAVKSYMIAPAGTNGGIGTVNCLQSAGQVMIRAIVPFTTAPFSSQNLTATMALGLANKSTTFFLPATAASLFNGSLFWVSGAPEAYGILLPAGLKDVLITTATTVIITVAVEEIMGASLGVEASIGLDVFWDPVSDGATLT